MTDNEGYTANELVQVLKSLTISKKELTDIELLYHEADGLPYCVDRKNAPQGETIRTCQLVGSRVKRALGSKCSETYGMNIVGCTDSENDKWCMRNKFRAALDSLGWFGPANKDQFQEMADEFQEKVKDALADSASAREKRLSTAERLPKAVLVSTVAYVRNPDVVAQALVDAAGYCQSCGSRAPFLRKSDGTPYLEVHHRIPLAEGGEDTVANAVALCPNCHRMVHYGNK